MFHVKHPVSNPLEVYKTLLVKYHNALDLMSDQALAIIDTKISESLQYAQLLETLKPEAPVVLDIGSGSGLPGVPLAIALPHWHLHLVERRQRRATFLKVVQSHLGLNNITIHPRPVENIENVQAPVVSALAVGSFTTLYCLSRHLHTPTITLLSRKGYDFVTEITALETTLGLKVHRVEATPLASHGRLVAVTVAGGVPCRLSGS